MEYSIKASSSSKSKASIRIKQSEINFGITAESSETLANPAEIFLGSFSSCILKNVERFSIFMDFEYSKADIIVKATRLDKPPRIDEIDYVLRIFSNDNNLNSKLLHRNIEKYGTIFNTVQTSCSISGEIVIISE